MFDECSNKKTRKGVSKKNKICVSFWLYSVYIALLFVLITFFFPRALAGNFNRKLFEADVNVLFCFVSLLVSILCMFLVKKRYMNITFTSQITTLILIFLYFIPGFFINSTVNVSVDFFISYLVFFLVFVFADILFPYPKKPILLPYKISCKTEHFIVVGTIAIVVLLMLFVNKSFNLVGDFLRAVRDTYTVRKEAAVSNIHWFFLGIEYWAAYFSIVMVTYYSMKKKRITALFFILVVLYFFTIQANRVMLFYLLAALVIGVMKEIDDKYIAGGLVLISLLMFVEVIIAPDNGKFITSFFTRFSVIPNRLGENYFDYFRSNTPDYLRLQFPRIMKLLGLPSAYADPPIAMVIGDVYYGMVMRANTGMIGSASLHFGIVGVFLEPVFIVLFLRLLDKITFGFENYKMRLVISLLMATMLINLPSIFTSALKLDSYVFWFLISLMLVSVNTKESLKKRV